VCLYEFIISHKCGRVTHLHELLYKYTMIFLILFKFTKKKPKMASVIFGSSIDSMKDELRRVHNATDDELIYLEKILSLRMKKREALSQECNGHAYPSVIIDNFLFHGDLRQASNLNILKRFNIQHIVNICDHELNQSIKDNLNILWIHFYDEMQEDIKQHFERTNQFLHECQLKNEKVLVHCQMGISRSSSIVLAYLIK